MSATILIIDDEEAIRESLAGILEDEGYHPLTAPSAEAGLAILAGHEVDLVLLDIWMEGMDGLEALERIRGEYGIPVIMISGHGTIETAVRATRAGAFDFIEKPLSYDKIVLAVNKGLHVGALERENRLLRDARPVPRLTGNSRAISRLREQIDRVAPTDASVLILGEHGTGKELVAQEIHRASPRAGRPMIEVNCAAIPEELIESELFGHEKGAFTGATRDRRGRFDQADGSTLFLDEIGDMSLKAQAKVLRILQERKFERVGGSRTISVDARILAATNKDLEAAINEGSFRADLYYRLNVVPLQVPPLRERREDIPQLTAAFLKRFADKGLGEKRLAPDALDLLLRHDWPGNVRELKNMIERLVIMCPEEEIRRRDVALFLQPDQEADTLPGIYAHLPYKEAKRRFEADFLRRALEENGYNVSRTAAGLGLERSYLHKKLKVLGVATRTGRNGS